MLGRSARARSLACSLRLPLLLFFFSFSFFPPFLLLHPLFTLDKPLFCSPPRIIECGRRERENKRVKKEKEREKEKGGKTIKKKTKTKRWSRFQNGNKTTQWSQGHQRGQSKKGAKRCFLETRLRGQGETASRINSVVLEISSTNQRSVPVAQPI